MGVGEFRRVYGGKDRRGSRPGHFALASGNIIRTILKQLETMKVLEKDPHGYVVGILCCTSFHTAICR